MSVIALAGRRYSGKTVAADLIVQIGEDMNVYVRKVSFIDPLRELFSKEKGISLRLLVDPETKEEFREGLVRFADEKRKEDPLILITALFASVSVNEHIVIDDMRTIEELQAVKKVGGKPYKVHASHSSREMRGYKYNPVIDNGILETEMDLSGDTFMKLGGGQIFNTGSRAYLKNQLFDLVRKEFKESELVPETASL